MAPGTVVLVQICMIYRHWRLAGHCYPPPPHNAFRDPLGLVQ